MEQKKKHLFSHLTPEKFAELAKIDRLYDKDLNHILLKKLKVFVPICSFKQIPKSEEKYFSLDYDQATKLDDEHWGGKRIAEILEKKKMKKNTQDYIKEALANPVVLDSIDYVTDFYKCAEEEGLIKLSISQKKESFAKWSLLYDKETTVYICRYYELMKIINKVTNF